MACGCSLALVIGGLAVTDSIATDSRNRADAERLKHVVMGMAETDVVKVMGRDPITMAGNPANQAFIFVWERTTLLHSLCHRGGPTSGKTIRLVDGRVSDVYLNMIFR